MVITNAKQDAAEWKSVETKIFTCRNDQMQDTKEKQ